MQTNLTTDELLQYFNIQEKIEKRLAEVQGLIGQTWPDYLPTPQDIQYTYMHENRKESDTGFVLTVYDHTCGDFYNVPVELLHLTDEELIQRAQVERKKYDKKVKLEKKRKQKSNEEAERKTLEYLLSKYADYSK